MTGSESPSIAAATPLLSVADPLPPSWVERLVAADPRQFTLFSQTVPDADRLDGPSLERVTASTYRSIGAQVLGSRLHPVRIWNFVPHILADAADGQDRYMRFNAGRYHAFIDWFGAPTQFDALVPAASAVGHRGSDLVVHVLACRTPGLPVSNPRQRPPYRYSRVFGPLPPCFARATRVGDRLFVGGTASICDEQSLHGGDLHLQFRETLQNLSAVLASGFIQQQTPKTTSQLTHVRVYHPREQDAGTLHALVKRMLPGLTSAEFFHAELCRGDLLVEVEGVARRSLAEAHR